ncbi:MAG: YolD-like family protein [Lachnospiraceae bacterium]|nr:YolD-like family protein [Lachnospiraceae bacterium]
MGSRLKMSPADRAKQFMPFAALKGYEEALRAKEKVVVPKMELSEEMLEDLDRKLHQIQRNDIITVVYYNGEEYVRVTGMVSRLDTDAKVLKVVNTRIPFENISVIEL